MVGSGRGGARWGGRGRGGGYLYYFTLQAVSLSASLPFPVLLLLAPASLLSPHSTPAHPAFAAAVAPAPSNPPCARATGREPGSCAHSAYAAFFSPGSNCPCLASGSGVVRPRFVLGALAAAASPPPTLSAPHWIKLAKLAIPVSRLGPGLQIPGLPKLGGFVSPRPRIYTYQVESSWVRSAIGTRTFSSPRAASAYGRSCGYSWCKTGS